MDAEKTRCNRRYKDSVFCKLFGEDKSNALSLANAISGKNYPPDTELEFNTIGDAIFMNIKNDVSFIIRNNMFLMEHQSTLCPNMAIRELMYFVRKLNEFVKESECLYGKKRIMFPKPRCFVFCNAQDMKEDSYVEKLSSSYMDQEADEDICEWTVRVVNVNYGHNEKLMQACETMRGYSAFVDKVRKWQKSKPGLEGVDEAIDECIREGYLVQFLTKHRLEVRDMAFEEFNAEKYIQQERDYSHQEGNVEGQEEMAKKLYQKGYITSTQAAEALEISEGAFLNSVRQAI
ncbi:MAG: hypothetical protein LUE14_10010 [Clostridiales bacterium]|nr:hypothetical protein [Clostridiales bacterium]